MSQLCKCCYDLLDNLPRVKETTLHVLPLLQSLVPRACKQGRNKKVLQRNQTYSPSNVWHNIPFPCMLYLKQRFSQIVFAAFDFFTFLLDTLLGALTGADLELWDLSSFKNGKEYMSRKG